MDLLKKVKQRMGKFLNIKAFYGIDVQVRFALTTFPTLYIIC
jgi:hypothetical protein